MSQQENPVEVPASITFTWGDGSTRTVITQPPIRFTENETGAEVLVSTAFVWGDENARQSAVLYPSGRVFSLTDAQLASHFSIVRPQKINISAYGGTDSRPTPSQKRLEDLGREPADTIANELAQPDHT